MRMCRPVVRMRTPVFLAVTVGLLMTPPSLAGGTTTHEYLLPPGVVILGMGGAICPQACISFPVPTNVIIGASDDLWGANVAMSVCYSDADDGTCTDDPVAGPQCGALAITASPFSGTAVLVLYTLLVADDLAVCGATHGSVALPSG